MRCLILVEGVRLVDPLGCYDSKGGGGGGGGGRFHNCLICAFDFAEGDKEIFNSQEAKYFLMNA